MKSWLRDIFAAIFETRIASKSLHTICGTQLLSVYSVLFSLLSVRTEAQPEPSIAVFGFTAWQPYRVESMPCFRLLALLSGLNLILFVWLSTSQTTDSYWFIHWDSYFISHWRRGPLYKGVQGRHWSLYWNDAIIDFTQESFENFAKRLGFFCHTPIEQGGGQRTEIWTESNLKLKLN